MKWYWVLAIAVGAFLLAYIAYSRMNRNGMKKKEKVKDKGKEEVAEEPKEFVIEKETEVATETLQ